MRFRNPLNRWRPVRNGTARLISGRVFPPPRPRPGGPVGFTALQRNGDDSHPCASLLPRNLRAGVGKQRAAMAQPFAYSDSMQDSLVCALRTQRTQIRERWATLLRVEPVGSPLGHPDSLVHLIDWTLDEIFAGVSNTLIESAPGGSRPSGENPAPCACGRNPLLTFFSAGEQAVREGLVLAQVALIP